MKEKIKVFLIGASGFIGHCLKTSLLSSGYDVVSTYNNSKLNDSQFKAIKKNILRDSLYSDFVEFKPDIVIHCAGLNPSVLHTRNDELFYQFNFDATLKLAHDFLRFCNKSDSRLRKFINLSTYEIYGNIKDIMGFNEAAKTNPLNAYADSKAKAVNEIETMYDEHCNFINIICTNNYGPYQSADKLIPVVFQKLIQDQEIIIHGDGSSQRTWTYVEDTCQGIMKVIESGNNKRYHLSSDDHISVIGVINSIHKLIRSKGLIETNSARLSWQEADNNPVFKINSNWSKKQLNWCSDTSFMYGLSRTINFLNE